MHARCERSGPAVSFTGHDHLRRPRQRHSPRRPRRAPLRRHARRHGPAAVYLGDRLGLYRALAAAGPRRRASWRAAGIAERYAREWLEQQAAAGILTSTTDARRTLRLPAGHAEVLLDERQPGYMAPLAQLVRRGGAAAARAARGVPDRRRRAVCATTAYDLGRQRGFNRPVSSSARDASGCRRCRTSRQRLRRSRPRGWRTWGAGRAVELAHRPGVSGARSTASTWTRPRSRWRGDTWPRQRAGGPGDVPAATRRTRPAATTW